MKDGFVIAIVDYGMGNLRSIENAIKHIGSYDVRVTYDALEIESADCIVIPGVGAFRDAMYNLESRGLVPILTKQAFEAKKPILGICLGMQLFFDSSDEGQLTKGLGWIPGSVKYIDVKPPYRVPHVGWNNLESKIDSRLLNNLGADKNFYFVHSYHAVCDEKYVTATVYHGIEVTASVQSGNIYGMQCHPEKSQQNGMIVLKNFLDMVGEGLDA
ncbi:imidazole glycerol phosphate synthase subunit HisH [Pseudomonadales bacterium]|nr:imidazole glycerol phosphate synthase subunit HisH [Pseudomonadales bacterium]